MPPAVSYDTPFFGGISRWADESGLSKNVNSAFMGQSGAQQQDVRNALVTPDKSNYQLPGGADLQSAFSNLGHGGLQSQHNAMNMAQNAAAGNGPSVAMAQMNQGITHAQQNANSMAAANRGGGGLGMRNAMMAGANASGEAAGAGAIARAQEQLGNMKLYGDMANADAHTRLAGLGGAAGVAGMQQAGGQQFSSDSMRAGMARSGLLDTQNERGTGVFNRGLDTAGKLFGAAGSAVSMFA